MKTNSIPAGLAVHARTIATTWNLIFRRAWLWTGFLAFATIAFGPPAAQAAVTEAWVQRYGSESEAGTEDYAYKVVTDAAGNVIVAGSSASPSPVYSGTQTGGGSDMLIIKYSGAGVPLWTNRYHGPGNGDDRPQTKSSLAIGSDGAVYVTGTSDGLFSSDFATVKYVWRPEIAIQLLSAIPPKVNLTLSAAPNSSWAIERARELTGPWTNPSALLIGTNGSALFQDTNSPSPAGFYRARQ